jgi:hypothetical protein
VKLEIATAEKDEETGKSLSIYIRCITKPDMIV